MLSRIGIVIFCIGVTMADSEWLLVPIALVAVGALLVKIGMNRGELKIGGDEEGE